MLAKPNIVPVKAGAISPNIGVSPEQLNPNANIDKSSRMLKNVMSHPATGIKNKLIAKPRIAK